MVFIKKTICIGFLILVGLTSCHAKDVDSVVVNGFNLSLQDGSLVYNHKDLLKKIDIGLSGEIHFIKNSSGTPQVEQTKWGNVVAVASSKKIANSSDCETTIKGIIISNSNVRISPKTQNIAMCGCGPQDRLMFINFAYTLHNQMNK